MQYDRIDFSDGIDINKTGASKECTICDYRYFKCIGYKFEPLVCNGCHDVLMLACELQNIAILQVTIDFFLPKIKAFFHED